MRGTAFFIVFLVAGSAQAADLIAQGHTMAEIHCARCHGIGRSDESVHDEAPPFRRLHERYRIETLAEAFAEGIVVGHKDMPPFEFAPQEIEALLAYIGSLHKDARKRR